MWIKPSLENLSQEYQVEVVLKGYHFVDSLESFLAAADKAAVVKVSKDLDSTIEYRSHTKSQDALLRLIKGYRSYPQYRNETTLQTLYDRIGAGLDMTMPIVLKHADGTMRILSGNTRADVAMQLIGSYEALVISI